MSDSKKEHPELLKRHKINEHACALSAAFSRDGNFVAAAYTDFDKFKNKVLIWDLINWKRVKLIRGCTKAVDDLAFTPDGNRLVCVGTTKSKFMGGEIKVWDSQKWTESQTIVGDDLRSLRTVAVSPDGKTIATGCALHGGDEDKIRLWTLDTAQMKKSFAKSEGDVKALTYSPDGKTLVFGLRTERAASVWRVPSAKLVWQKRVHTQGNHLTGVFSPDGKLIATCGDKNVGVWKTTSGEAHGILKQHTDDVSSIAFSPDGSRLYSSSYRELIVWDVATKKPLITVALDTKNYIALRPGDDERELVGVHTISTDLTIERLRLPAWEPVKATARMAPKKLLPTEVVIKVDPREQKFIDDVLENPDNDRPRLKYAAWLDKQGDPRGEFIRLQCAWSQMDTGAILKGKPRTEARKLHKRAEKLLDENFAAWTAPLQVIAVRRDQVTFRRGFLWKLDLQDVDHNDETLAALANTPELERLDLCGTGVTDDGIGHLKKVTNLRELELTETAVTVNALKLLQSLPRLYHAFNCDWGNGPIRELETFKRTRITRFKKLSSREQRDTAVRIVRSLSSYMVADDRRKYPDISMSQTWATNGDLFYLAQISEIESLDFFECDAVTEKGLKHLEPLKKLKTLRLTETGVTDLAPLKQFPRLEELNLDSLEHLKPSSFRHLVELKRLKRLTVRFCDLENEILKHISKCSTLEELDMGHNQFTSEGLEQLRALKNLRSVDFDYRDSHRDLVKALIGKAPKKRR